MNTVDTIELLNRLIVTAKNGENTLRAAAEEAHHVELKAALRDGSDFFQRAASDLQEAIRQIGGKPRELGSFDNTLHRTWMHLKSTALGRDESELLDMLEEDEASFERQFAAAVARDDTDPDIHALLERQYEGARRQHEEIRGWQHLQLH